MQGCSPLSQNRTTEFCKNVLFLFSLYYYILYPLQAWQNKNLIFYKRKTLYLMHFSFCATWERYPLIQKNMDRFKMQCATFPTENIRRIHEHRLEYNGLVVSTKHFDWTHSMSAEIEFNSTGTSNFTPPHRCSNYLFIPNPTGTVSKPNRAV